MGAGTLRLNRMRPIPFSRIWERIQVDDCVDLAAQTSFYFALSLLPFCLVLAVFVGWLPSTAMWKSFATWMVTYLPRQSREVIFSTILSLVNYSAGFLSLGLITAIWSASSGFVSLMESLSIVYGKRDSRSYWRKHAIGTCVTVLAMFFAMATFGLMAFGRWGYELFPATLRQWNISRGAWNAGRWGLTAVILCLALDLINFVLPDVKRPWRWVTPGTVFVLLTLVAMSAGFNLYFQHFSSYPRLYGALGGFIILMLWIYFATLILLVGAEADREIERLPARAERSKSQ
jgi:membrane protein